MKRFIALTFLAGAASAFAASPYDNPYSIITVDTKPSSDIHLKPVFVNRVDGENSVERNKHVVPPGAHDVTLDLAPRGGFHEPTQQVFKMKTEACVRYNVAARVENSISQKWEPVVRSTEPIGECAAKFKVAAKQ